MSSVEEVLSSFPIGPVSSVQPFPGGFNESFRVSSERGEFVLKCHARASRDLVEAEMELLLLLAENGVPVPVPVVPDEGMTVDWDGRPCSLVSFIEGERLDDDFSVRMLRLLASTVARMHVVADSFGRELPVIDALSFAERQADHNLSQAPPQAQVLLSGLQDALLSRIRGNPALDSLPVGLVHGGLKRHNLLWSDDVLRGITAFDDVGHGPLLFDLQDLLFEFCLKDHPQRFDLARAMLSAYDDSRPLSDDERQSLFSLMVCWQALNCLYDLGSALERGDPLSGVARIEGLERLERVGERAFMLELFPRDAEY